jgi:hypothetical protein
VPRFLFGDVGQFFLAKFFHDFINLVDLAKDKKLQNHKMSRYDAEKLMTAATSKASRPTLSIKRKK